MTSLDPDSTLRDALHLVEEARSRGISLRLTGGAAVQYHNHSGQLRKSDSEIDGLKDVDMVTYSSDRVEVSKLFNNEGYVADRYVMAYFGEDRFLFHNLVKKYSVDIFFENLNFNHKINLRPKGSPSRIELDYPTLTLADLVLSKLQIHEALEKDLRDLQVLILEHPLTNVDVIESINTSRIASVLADDWGFYHDAKVNLSKVITGVSACEIREKVNQIIDVIDSEPKSKAWEKREHVGITRQWWSDVEELVR